SLTFDGVNSFSNGLSLTSAGAITQATGATLSVIGGNLVVTNSTAITLTNTGNSLGSLGAVTSTGAISITTSAGMTLNNNISAGGAIGLTAVGVIFAETVTINGGDLTLNSGTGTITQTAGKSLTITGGKLMVGSSSGITLTNSGNGIVNLGGLISSGAISIITSGAMALSGSLNSGGAIAVTATSLSITAGMAINGGNLSLTTTGGNITQTSGSTLTLFSGKSLSMTASGSISLDEANAIWDLGAVTATGGVSIKSGTNLTVTSNIVSGDTITIQTAGNLTLSKSTNFALSLTGSGEIRLVTTSTGPGSKITLQSPVETSGGNLVLEIGKNGDDSYSGTFEQNGSGNRLNTNGKDLTLKADAVTYTVGSQVFSLTTPATPNDLTKTGTYYDSNTRVSPTTLNLVSGATKIYFYTGAAGSGIAGADWRDINALSNLSYTMTSGMTRGEVTGKINYSGSSGLSAVTVNAPVVFYNINNGALPNLEITVTGAVEFIGTNRFSSGIWLKSTGAISQAAGASVALASGELSLRSSGGEINFAQPNNRLRQIGTIVSTGAITLNNSGTLDLNGNLSAAGAITIRANAVGSGAGGGVGSTQLSLLKPVTTSGGAVTIDLGSGVFDGGGFAFSTSNQNLTISLGRYNLSTAGSSIDLGSGILDSTILVNTATTLGSGAGQIGSNAIFDPTKITAGETVLKLFTAALLTIADVTVARPLTIATGDGASISFAGGESRFTDLTISSLNAPMTQGAGSSLLISGRLVVTTNGGINLANATNRISSLGKISGTASPTPPVKLTINLGNPDGGARLTDDISNSGGAIKLESAAALTIGKTGGLTITAGNQDGIDFTVKDVTLSSNLNTKGGAVVFKGSRGKSYTDGGFTLTTDHSDLSLEHSTLNLTAVTSFSEGTGTAVATFAAKGIGVESTSNLVVTGNSVQDSSGATIGGATTPLPIAKINFNRKLGGGFHTTGTVNLSGTITNEQLLNISADAGISVNGTVSTEGKDLTLLSNNGNIAISGSVTVGNLSLNSADTVLEVGQGEINASTITVVAQKGIDLSKSSNRIASVKSLTTTRGDIRLNSTGDLNIDGPVTSNPGALLLRVDGKVTASVSLTGYSGVDIIATKLIWSDRNLSLGTAAPNGKTVKSPTYSLAYRSTQFGQSIDGHIWVSLSQPDGVDPTIKVTPVAIPAPPTPAAETPVPISVVPIAQAPVVEVEIFSGIPVFTPTPTFTQPTNSPGAQLFTVSASTTATARSEFKNHDIIYPNLKASMNTLLTNGEFEEGTTEDYYIPLEGNSSLW
ncbi:MAG: hypothetical protein ORO03_11480, partial [Alphaproteobacteria bacterium]|nr:hypothetical protein [Alphaproteobacteria bacterium]